MVMFETLFWTVFFCLGLRVVTDEGKLLYFLREPFDYSYKQYEYKTELLKLAAIRQDKSSVDELKSSLLRHKLIVYIGKPLITCITCMASIWGISVFVTLNGLNENLIAPLIFNSFAASFIQTFIWSFYAKHIQ